MGTLGKDAKDLIMGNDGSDKEPEDFKPELDISIKKGIITKAEGSVLIEAREDVDKLGKKIDKMQSDAAKKIKDEEPLTKEELEAKEKKEKEKKKEEERKKQERDISNLNSINKSKNKILKNDDISKSHTRKERENEN